MDSTPDPQPATSTLAYEAPAIEEQTDIVGLLNKDSSGNIIGP